MDAVNSEAMAASLPDSSKPVRAKRVRSGQTGMSYKFQRLREKLRSAIASGELAGKLPGERALARRFHVNAKTLSKALTDLAAEGVLDRSVGRGTYVKGSEPAPPNDGRWLIIAEPQDVDSPLIQALRERNPEMQVNIGSGDIRPSFLNQFSAVVDIAPATPDSFLRDLVIRNIPVVTVNREPRTYSMHAVLQDLTLGVSRLGRDLALRGHRRFAAVEPRESSAISIVLRQIVSRFAPDATADSCAPQDVPALIEAGVTAIVCSSTEMAGEVTAILDRAEIRRPRQVSLAAVGCIGETLPCSGYFCSAGQLAESVGGLLRDAIGMRPAVLWLTGDWRDAGTVAGIDDSPRSDAIDDARMGELVV